jgi:hypothetical protein
MTDIADEFKIVVVEAIKSLCLKFPQKYPILMNFLSNILREEGGFDYKKAIGIAPALYLQNLICDLITEEICTARLKVLSNLKCYQNFL